VTRRSEIFEVLCQYAAEHKGNSPSLRDLLTEMHKHGYAIGQTTLYFHLTYLEGQGVLERRDGKLIVVKSEWTPPPFD